MLLSWKLSYLLKESFFRFFFSFFPNFLSEKNATISKIISKTLLFIERISLQDLNYYFPPDLFFSFLQFFYPKNATISKTLLFIERISLENSSYYLFLVIIFPQSSSPSFFFIFLSRKNLFRIPRIFKACSKIVPRFIQNF